jgi:hypothetical protein
MKEGKSIEAIDRTQMQLRPETKSSNEARRSNVKDSGSIRNTVWKWLQLMQEDKCIEVQSMKMQTRQESRSSNRLRRRLSRDADTWRSRIWRLCKLMKECRLKLVGSDRLE